MSSTQDVRYVDFSVRGLTLDPNTNMPILLLQDHGGRLVLPIWIGAFEAGAIAAELEGHRWPRPMTHDLLKATIEGLGARVVRIDVTHLQEGTFFATLVLEREDGTELRLDCRPSDAVALAVRAAAPIRVAGPVLKAAHPLPTEEQTEHAEPARVASADDDAARRRLIDSLAAMDPEDFGKYKM
jgi:bifunctional DNase/RNase